MAKSSFDKAYEKATADGKSERLDMKMVKWSLEDPVLIGRFVSQEVMPETKFDTPVQRYIFDTDAGRMSCLLGAATDKQMVGKMLAGDLMRIEYEGTKDIGGGKKVNLFKIEKFGHEEPKA